MQHRDCHILYLIEGRENRLLSEWKKEGATVESLELDVIANTYFPIPPSLEQNAIIDFIMIQVEKIDSLEAKISMACSHLQEYRTALISAAVTGKIDVRGEMPDPKEIVESGN